MNPLTHSCPSITLRLACAPAPGEHSDPARKEDALRYRPTRFGEIVVVDHDLLIWAAIP